MQLLNRLEVDPAPDARPHPPRRFALPAGSVDTHAHVIGNHYIDERSYTPHPAPPEAYLRMLDATGLTHGVLVQVSVHGSDNSLLLRNVRVAAEAMAPVAAEHQLVFSHGNGPQVGLLALQGAAYNANEIYPLDVLGAETEGMIGYMIEQELGNLLPFEVPFATILTMVEVDVLMIAVALPLPSVTDCCEVIVPAPVANAIGMFGTPRLSAV